MAHRRVYDTTMARRKVNPWSKRIKALQKQLGYDNRRMAEALGIATDTLHSWKYRPNSPSTMGQRLIECLEQQQKPKK